MYIGSAQKFWKAKWLVLNACRKCVKYDVKCGYKGSLFDALVPTLTTLLVLYQLFSLVLEEDADRIFLSLQHSIITRSEGLNKIVKSILLNEWLSCI